MKDAPGWDELETWNWLRRRAKTANGLRLYRQIGIWNLRSKRCNQPRELFSAPEWHFWIRSKNCPDPGRELWNLNNGDPLFGSFLHLTGVRFGRFLVIPGVAHVKRGHFGWKSEAGIKSRVIFLGIFWGFLTFPGIPEDFWEISDNSWGFSVESPICKIWDLVVGGFQKS